MSSPPTTTMAPRGPAIATSTGTARDPTASPAISRPSRALKTRPWCCPGTVRWRTVRPPTSSTVRPAPAIASRHRAAPSAGHAPTATNAAPHIAPARSSGRARRWRPTRREGDGGADQPTRPEHRAQITGAPRTEPENHRRQDDLEHVECAEHGVFGGQHRQRRECAGGGANRRRQRALTLLLVLIGRAPPQPAQWPHHDRRARDDDREHGHCPSRSGADQHHARNERTCQDAHVVHPARHDVGGCQLRGRLDHRGQQRTLGRSCQRHRAGGDHRAGIDDRRRSATQHQRGGGPD